MTRSRMLFTLLSLWLFAIAAPSIITLVDVDNPVVVTNLNEEEQQEQGKKNIGEKELINDGSANLALRSKKGNRSNFAFYLGKSLETNLEIVLPPPEHS